MTLLPANASPLEKALAGAVALPALPVPIRHVKSPSAIPEALLPWLGWERSVDDWDASWPLGVRRALVAASLGVHRRKGTLAAVRAAVAAFGGALIIKEWWETSPAGAPGTFTLTLALTSLDGSAPSSAYISSVIGQVARASPLTRHFTFTLAIDLAGAVGLKAVVRPVVYARLDCTA